MIDAATAQSFALTLHDGSCRWVTRPQEVADALRGWGREPGSHAALAAADGRALQAAGDQAQGFQLRLQGVGASPLRSERIGLNRAEVVRRLQAFLGSAQETGPRAAWRRGRRWRTEAEIVARAPRSPWLYWRRWVLLLLALQVVPAVFTGSGLWLQARTDRFLAGAVRHEARVVRNEPDPRRASWRQVTLRLLDGPGQYTQVLKKGELFRAQPGHPDAVWVGRDGEWTPDSLLCRDCGHMTAGLGLLFHALTWMGMLVAAWQNRFRSPPADRFSRLDAGARASETMPA